MKDYNIDHLIGSRNPEDIAEITEMIISLQDFDFRVIDYVSNKNFWEWKRLGLLDMRNIRDGEKQRRGVTGIPTKMNLLGYFWVRIVSDLKSLGVKSFIINVIKEMLHYSVPIDEFLSPGEYENKIELFEVLTSKTSSDVEALKSRIRKEKEQEGEDKLWVHDLFMMIYFLIYTRHDIRLIIHFNGMASFYDAYQVSADTVHDKMPYPVITIPLKHYLKPLLMDEDRHKFLSRHNMLSSKEEKIFEVLRQEDVSELHVRMKGGEPYMMTVDKRNKIDTRARLSEVILKGGYEEITLKTEFGKMVFSQTSHKTKL